MYLREHWPSDVVGAYLFASLWLAETARSERCARLAPWKVTASNLVGKVDGIGAIFAADLASVSTSHTHRR